MEEARGREKGREGHIIIRKSESAIEEGKGEEKRRDI